MCIRNSIGPSVGFGAPLICTGRTLRQFPLVAEEVPEEVIAPLRRRGGPGDFQATGDRVSAFAFAKAALPTQALFLYSGRFWLRPNMGR